MYREESFSRALNYSRKADLKSVDRKVVWARLPPSAPFIITKLSSLGHETVAAAPNTGVNTLTGEGLAEVLKGAEVVVDVSNSPSFEDAAVMDFFQASTRNLLSYGTAASVGHHVALSVVGSERLPRSGYMRAKVAQEKLIKVDAASRLNEEFPLIKLPVLILHGTADKATNPSGAVVALLSDCALRDVPRHRRSEMVHLTRCGILFALAGWQVSSCVVGL